MANYSFGNFSTTDYWGRNLIFNWEIYNQDIENNKTTINWSITGGKVNDSVSGWLGAGNFKVVIDGETVYSSSTRIELSVGTRVASGSKTLTHNTDGTKTFTAYVEAGIYYYTVNCSGSGSWSIEPIPRAAKITYAPTFSDEDVPEVFYSNPLGNSATSLKLGIVRADNNASIIASRAVNKTKTSYVFNFTDSERQSLQKAVINDLGLNVKFILETVIGSKTFTDTATVYMRIVNSSPTFTYTITATDSITNEAAGGDTIIKEQSIAVVDIVVNPQKQATIKEIVVSNGDTKYQVLNTNTFHQVFNTVSIEYFTVLITDSRGNVVNQKIYPKKWIPWFNPTCNIENATLTSGGELTFSATGKALNTNFGIHNNNVYFYYRYKENNGNYTNDRLITSVVWENNTFNLTFTIPETLNYKKVYVVELLVMDTFGDATSVITVKSFPIFDWSDEDFNFNVPVSINGVEQDYIVESGKTGIWYWRKWNSGIAECFGTVSVNTTINTAWGSMYVGNTKMSRQNYPITFITKPTETATLQSGANACWLFAESGGNGVNGGYATAIYNVCRPNAITASGTYYISIRALGYWK